MQGKNCSSGFLHLLSTVYSIQIRVQCMKRRTEYKNLQIWIQIFSFETQLLHVNLDTTSIFLFQSLRVFPISHCLHSFHHPVFCSTVFRKMRWFFVVFVVDMSVFRKLDLCVRESQLSLQKMDVHLRYKVPEGLRPLLEALARETLRSQPKDVVRFAQLFFDELQHHRKSTFQSEFIHSFSLQKMGWLRSISR